MAQAQILAPSPNLAQIVPVGPAPDCHPVHRLEQLAKSIPVDLLDWCWFEVPVLGIFGLPLGAAPRAGSLPCMCPQACVLQPPAILLN